MSIVTWIIEAAGIVGIAMIVYLILDDRKHRRVRG